MNRVRIEESESNVVVLKPRPEIVYKHPESPRLVTQQDLAELAELRRRKRVIEKAIRLKRSMIRYAMEHGAGIEDGPRSARLGERLIVA